MLHTACTCRELDYIKSQTIIFNKYIGGIDFESNCLCSVTAKFWTQFSQEFAEVATGNTFYLTDGEDASGAYRRDSFFATVELPNMNDDRVTRLVALVVHREGEGIIVVYL